MSSPDPAEDRGDCIFCRIADGDASADVVERTDLSVAFRDINPQMPVHVLVIPRRHVTDASHLGPEHAAELADLYATARRVAASEGVLERGYRTVFNVGPDSANTVPHLHLHVLGGRPMGWPPG